MFYFSGASEIINLTKTRIKHKTQNGKDLVFMRLVTIPENVSLYNVQATVLGFLYKVGPHLQPCHRPLLSSLSHIYTYITVCIEQTYLWSTSWIVNGARDQNLPFPVDHKGTVVVSYIGRRSRHHYLKKKKRYNLYLPSSYHFQFDFKIDSSPVFFFLLLLALASESPVSLPLCVTAFSLLLSSR